MVLNNLSEEALELEVLKKLDAMKYRAIDCRAETFGDDSMFGRKSSDEVVLRSVLKEKLIELNKNLPSEAIDDALNTLLQPKSTLNLIDANKYYYDLIKNGVMVTFKDEKGTETPGKVVIIDWNNASNNDFLIARQFKISGEIYNCRADMVLFVNGLPLVFIELKSSIRHLENAYNDNIRHYIKEIPQAFFYNAFIIISNGTETKIGSLTSTLDHYSEWTKVNEEDERGVISLDTTIKAVLGKDSLIDFVENFILFQNTNKGVVKIVGKNHQFLGVNRTFNNIKNPGKSDPKKLGVFWHTQGSGKSFSMVFLAQKVLRKLPGNWTFLVLTDRKDLDTQIYENFVSTEAVTEKSVKATNKEHLGKLLTKGHRYIFSMIQKFEGAEKVSERSDILVFSDEAHRTQYGKLAMSMRKALPNARFLAFTGTPLMKGDEKTKNVFGGYASIYNFEQSVADKATVKLYYENRRPDLQIINPEMEKDIQKLIDDAELSEEQEEKFAKEYVNMYQAITRDDRLEKVAEDIVEHFMNRGFMGKAMYVSVDKATAIKMYEKVKKYWDIYIKKLEKEYKNSQNVEQQSVIKDRINYMKSTDMAVVVSASQNEDEYCSKYGVDIKPHRKRMNSEELDNKFKDSEDPLRIVFVCSMWITGFDAKCVSTMYIDKILREHTLMQTIARANRVAENKPSGLIIDYIGIFKALEKALALYGSVDVDGEVVDDTPAFDKSELIKLLDKSSKKMSLYCKNKKIDVEKIFSEKDNFKKIALCDEAVEAILSDDESKKTFQENVSELKKLLKAVLPDVAADGYLKQVLIVSILSSKIYTKLNKFVSKTDIEILADKVSRILNESIKVSDYNIESKQGFELTKIDFEILKKRFAEGKKKTVIEQLKEGIRSKIQDMMKLNKKRQGYMEKFQDIINSYNDNDVDLEQLFNELINFCNDLESEEKRHISESLTEEELAILDILTKPAPEMTKKDIDKVKKAAKELLDVLKKEKLIPGWRKMQSSRAKVKVTIDKVCDAYLPAVYDERIFKEKCNDLYIHFYDNYSSGSQSIYSGYANI